MKLNKFIGIGRWTKDLEITVTNSGKEVVKGTIAITDKFKKDHTDFINVVMFGKTGVLAEQFTKKGSLVAIEGKIQTGKYQNNEGKMIYTFDVIADSVQFLEPKNNGNTNTPESKNESNTGQKNSFSDDPFGSNKTIDIPSDELPW
jgi:single-strand DNA-binding protein